MEMRNRMGTSDSGDADFARKAPLMLTSRSIAGHRNPLREQRVVTAVQIPDRHENRLLS
jgi:hypothetical protein